MHRWEAGGEYLLYDFAYMYEENVLANIDTTVDEACKAILLPAKYGYTANAWRLSSSMPKVTSIRFSHRATSTHTKTKLNSIDKETGSSDGQDSALPGAKGIRGRIPYYMLLLA